MDESGVTSTWREQQRAAEERLAAAGIDGDPATEARWLVEETSGYEGAELLLALDAAASERGVQRLRVLTERRAAGEPIQYVLGHWPFRALDLLVDRRVLIPRPETEHVVELALAELDRVTGGARRGTAVDLGSGSGAIGLSIAAERAGVDVWCIDSSEDAAAVTRANLAGLGMAGGRVRVAVGDWFEPLPDDRRGAVELLVSNPPYIGAAEDLAPSVRDWEPVAALVPGPTGLEAIEIICAQAPDWLVPGGALVVEIGAGQGPAAAGLAEAAGLVDVQVHPDLAAHDRTLIARRP